MAHPELPPGIPSMLKVTEVAQVLRLSERTVRSWVETGVMSYCQPSGRRGARYVPTSEVIGYAHRLGLPLTWEVLL